MSIFTKFFAAIKKIKIEKSTVDEAGVVVTGIKGIVALVEKDLADGHIDIGEIIGLVFAVIDLVNIARKSADKE